MDAKKELCNFPFISGSLAQLVQIDLESAEAAILTLLSQPKLSAAMGRAARQRANSEFHPKQVMSRFAELFSYLNDLRRSADISPEISQPPLRFDPVRCFSDYASHKNAFRHVSEHHNELPSALCEARKPFFEQLAKAVPEHIPPLNWQVLRKRKHS